MDGDRLTNALQILQPEVEGANAPSQSQAPLAEQAVAPLGTFPKVVSRAGFEKKRLPSCNLCRRSKIKCDRADPCSHCVRIGAVCVTPTLSGAPRGRKGGRRKAESVLLDRIAKLEDIVKNIEGRYTTNSSIPGGATDDGNLKASEDADTRISNAPSVTSKSKPPRAGLEKYLGDSLWMTLSDEINGMREVLSPSSDDDEDDNETTPSSSSLTQSGQPNFTLFAPNNLPNLSHALQHPSPSQVQSIYGFFMSNVEPLVKMLHGPSLRRYLVENSGKLECSPGPKGWDALKFAIYYTTTSSLTPEECSKRLGDDKALLLQRFRSGTELALAQADFITTKDVSTLQALVLYLFALRSNENSGRTWTLTSLAVRIGHALRLHREPGGGKYASALLPFDREMRRRLWWQICILDRHASADLGTDPIITTNSFSTQLPLNVNDEDLIPGDHNEVQPREEFTDYTLSLVCHEVFDIERRLNYIPAGEIGPSYTEDEDPWSQRRGWVIERQQRIVEKYLRHCDMNICLQRYTKQIADIMFASMWLWAYRPLQKRLDGPIFMNIPPAGVLQIAVEVMEKAIQIPMDDSTEPFRWISTIWVQWHALAVMIAELCVQTEGPTVERAWSFLDIAYEETARHVADSERGWLWRPIRKLMNKAQEVRRKHLEDASSYLASMPVTGAAGSASLAIPLLNAQLSELNMMPSGEVPTLMENTSSFPQQFPQSVTDADPMSLDWSSWAQAGPLDQMNNTSSEMSQMAWINWESLVDDFQADGNFLPMRNDIGFNMW